MCVCACGACVRVARAAPYGRATPSLTSSKVERGGQLDFTSTLNSVPSVRRCRSAQLEDLKARWHLEVDVVDDTLGFKSSFSCLRSPPSPAVIITIAIFFAAQVDQVFHCEIYVEHNFLSPNGVCLSGGGALSLLPLTLEWRFE